MDELDFEKIVKKIAYERPNELEPNVLNKEIITKAIYDQGPDGEAGRLFRSTEIHHDKVTVLRLEFLNILKIDHLWILPNLQILSLAFNKIRKIENLEELSALKELSLTFNSIDKLENLEGLKSLEILSVFGNKITKIENVDCLDNLIIFSAGNNLIATSDGIERLRFLKKLRSLNLKGNAVEEGDKFFRMFIGALLPNLTYYEYKFVSQEERDDGEDRFQFQLLEIMNNEKIEVQEREQSARDKLNLVHLMECFVEQLDQHQLFESLFCFENEDQGSCLVNIGEEGQNLISEFKDQSFVITQRVYETGLEQFVKRQNKQKIFENCVKIGRKKVQLESQRIIETFSSKQEEIFSKVNSAAINHKSNSTEDSLYEIIGRLTEEYNHLHDLTLKSLMENELHLHESVIESNMTFKFAIQDLINDFIAQCYIQFVQLREAESKFVDELVKAVQNFVSIMTSTGRESDIPEELRTSLIDRDIIHNYAAGMREMQIEKIDAREDLLTRRAKEWMQKLCEKLQMDEVDRNRHKVMEINYFFDDEQVKFEKLTTAIGIDIVACNDIGSVELN